VREEHKGIVLARRVTLSDEEGGHELGCVVSQFIYSNTIQLDLVGPSMHSAFHALLTVAFSHSTTQTNTSVARPSASSKKIAKVELLEPLISTCRAFLEHCHGYVSKNIVFAVYAHATERETGAPWARIQRESFPA
jgi:hypothetical protein